MGELIGSCAGPPVLVSVPHRRSSFWLLQRGIPIGPSAYSRLRHQDAREDFAAKSGGVLLALPAPSAA
jgi:hypothetical protein